MILQSTTMQEASIKQPTTNIINWKFEINLKGFRRIDPSLDEQSELEYFY